VTLPKAHLHLHLEAAMRPSTLEALADRYGMSLPSTRRYTDFTAFVDAYRATARVLCTPADMQRLVLEAAEDAAADGAVWIEPAVCPPGYADRLGNEEVLEILMDAATVAKSATGVGIGVIVAADRTQSPVEAVQLAQLAARYAGRGVVAFGLAGDESLFPPEPFAEAFSIARTAGLLSVPHAGELAGPESVRAALDELRADRIQHGVRAIEDPALVERLAQAGVCLDVCPTSNLLLGVVPDLAAHPLPALMSAGVRCSLNADDPLLFGVGLADEYRIGREALGLDDAALARLAASSIEASSAPQDVKRSALAGISAWLAAAAPGTDL
jgi:adenosine deaminase